jgi:hypothetical protein
LGPFEALARRSAGSACRRGDRGRSYRGGVGESERCEKVGVHEFDFNQAYLTEAADRERIRSHSGWRMPKSNDIRRYRENLRGEVDGAAVYRMMASAEPDVALANVYRRLAEVDGLGASAVGLFLSA